MGLSRGYSIPSPGKGISGNFVMAEATDRETRFAGVPRGCLRRPHSGDGSSRSRLGIRVGFTENHALNRVSMGGGSVRERDSALLAQVALGHVPT